MKALSPGNGDYCFGPFGPTLGSLFPGARFERILDLGCGDGSNTQHLAHVAREVRGVDADAQLIERARLAYPTISFTAGTAEEFLKNTPLTFDAVVCSRLLGFIPDLAALFMPLRARTRGWFLVSDWHPLACWISPDGIIGMDYAAEGLFAPGQYHHSISAVTNALIAAGFSIQRVVEAPLRQTDPLYAETPPAVQGLPLTMTWVCRAPAEPI